MLVLWHIWWFLMRQLLTWWHPTNHGYFSETFHKSIWSSLYTKVLEGLALPWECSLHVEETLKNSLPSLFCLGSVSNKGEHCCLGYGWQLYKVDWGCSHPRPNSNNGSQCNISSLDMSRLWSNLWKAPSTTLQVAIAVWCKSFGTYNWCGTIVMIYYAEQP